MLAPLRLCQLVRPAKSEPLAAFLFFDSFGSIGVALRAMQKQFAASLSEIQWNADRDRDLIQSVILFRQTRRQFRTAPLYKVGVALYAAGRDFGRKARYSPARNSSRLRAWCRLGY